MAALLLALCACLACLTPASQAAPPSLEFVSATKALKPETTEVTFTARVTNRTSVPWTPPAARFCYSTTKLTKPSQLANAHDCNVLVGNAVKVADQLQPGESRDFTVRVDANKLPKPQGRGVLIVGATLPMSSQSSLIATTAIASVGETLKLRPVVVLSAAPDRLYRNRFSNDDLLSDFSGRLTRLLEYAEKPGVSVVIDPALYESAAFRTQPYRSADKLQPASPEAQAWLERLDKRLQQPNAYRTLYALPRMTGQQVSVSETVRRAARATNGVEELANLPMLVLPTDGVASAPIMSAAAQVKARAVLATNAINTGVSEVGVISTATETSKLTNGNVADYLGAQGDKVVVYDSTEALPPTDLPPWVELSGLPDEFPHEPVTLTNAKPNPWHGDWPRPVEATKPLFSRFEDLSADPEVARLRWDQFTSAATSGHWPTDAVDAASFVAAATADVEPLGDPGQFELLTSPKFVMTSTSNPLPVTIRNNSTKDVSLVVRLKSQTPQRIKVADTEPTTVPARESVTVQISPEATSNGTVEVVAQLATSSGTSIGPEHTFTISASGYGDVGWLIIIVAGAVVLISTAWRVRRFRQTEREADPSE